MKKLILIAILLIASICSYAQDSARIIFLRQWDSLTIKYKDPRGKVYIDSLMNIMKASYNAPEVQGVKIEGTIEEVEKKFEENGWTDYYADIKESMNKAEWAEAHKKVIVMNGYFLRKPAEIVLSPISPEDHRISYCAVSFDVDELFVKKFVEYDVYPLVKQYSEKYGDYKVFSEDERYESATENTTRFDYGSDKEIINFGFENGDIMLRAQVGSKDNFNIVIHYINNYHLMMQHLYGLDKTDEI